MAGKTKKKRKKIVIRNRLSVIGILTVALILNVIMLAQTRKEQQINRGYQETEQELEAMSERESERAEEIEELREKITTDEYIEKIAIEKLGLVPKDEIIFEEEN
ncbi:MAG: septum formation initiator family protein [Lachnospiraceae bacterium]|nr:septum formation initiator family protein [Robinsoniella sp.]MDY3766304.1 septum formation initiator family protein [Lachnospiraceae bacterium]